MKAVILAGGLGTRISEETSSRPKPMIEIGGRPILWHIMKLYSAHGVQDFVICCGYKGYMIKEYFANYFLHMSDVTIDMAENAMEVHNRKAEPWRVTLVDTGDETMTGGSIKRISQFEEGMRPLFSAPPVADSETMMYSDGFNWSLEKSRARISWKCDCWLPPTEMLSQSLEAVSDETAITFTRHHIDQTFSCHGSEYDDYEI
mgnify:CR=1 FL=1